ncbi:MAG: DUF2281 domain-containing protein [Caldilineaceae bacterium]|nr:DUF2281 domain-containing protein [Caldilineaceae bacterium]MBP8108118.1 DUF2281 domain-containing protein [Caldilineaceae bacterium]MBP8123080.1 DUF2281 domain-containing protein [Caldilineaceae bacterium]MBP9070727.1 DUF2281 domain-containing protein [Caldilineaceae bacterium]
MQYVDVAEKIQTLPEPLLREVGNFVDFLLARNAQQTQAILDELPADLLARLAVAGGSFDWLDDPAEDIYSDADGEPV